MRTFLAGNTLAGTFFAGIFSFCARVAFFAKGPRDSFFAGLG